MIVYQCNEEVSSKLKVIVLNNQNVPIHNATISLDDIKIGKTDKDGVYYHELKGIKGKALKLEVTKDSSTHYYAPYFEKIVLSPDKHSPIKVKAILYSVPKPKKDKGMTNNPSVEEGDDLPILVDSHGLVEEKLKKVEEVRSKDNTIVDSNISHQPIDHFKIDKNKPFQGDLKKLSIIANKIAYTVHVTNQKKSVADAEVYLGDPVKGFLKSACKTNLKGKCTIKLHPGRNKVLSFVVKKQGFVTKTLTTRLKKKGFLRVSLTRGQCLDLFTLKSNYHYLRGVSGISVYVNSRKVGHTDKFGHLSYVYQGPSDDLLKVSFKTKRYLPEVFEVDFVTSPKMTLTRFLTDKTPPKPRFTLLPVRLAGIHTEKIPDIKKVNRFLHSASKFIMTKNNALEFPYENLMKHLGDEAKKVNDVITKGWTGLNIKAHVDALILPTILDKNGSIYVDISLYNNKGEIIAAAAHKLEDFNNRIAYNKLMKGLALKINRLYPFEGAVLGANKKALRINLNKKNTPFLAKNDLIEVFGRQINPLGSAQEHKKIGIAKVSSVSNEATVAELVWQSPRSVIGRGDMIILRKGISQDNLKRKNYPILVSESLPTGNRKGKGIAQVNVYLNNHWLGSSNERGLVAIRNSRDLASGGALTFVKHGYETKNVNLFGRKKGRLDITLNRLLAFVQIDSKPAGAKVYLDGSYVGQTPIHQPFETSSGFIKLRLKSPPGYKDIAQVLELEEGVLDLTGGASILLELDILRGITDLIKLESYEKAISMLERIDKQHSDYLRAQHLLGEVFLSKLKDPESAAKAFEKVLQNPRVNSFHNKQFIGSYINYVEALSQMAHKKEENNWIQAKEIYEKVLGFGQKIQSQLKFVPSDQRILASKKLKYYEALAMSKLSAKSRDLNLKRKTMEKWQNFVEAYSEEENKQELSDLLGNAKIFLKQAKSTVYQNDVNL